MRGSILQNEIKISDSELSARLSLPVTSFPEGLDEIKKSILDASDVKFVATRIGILENDGGRILFENGLSVSSEALSKYLIGSDEVILFIMTLGAGVDRLITRKGCISLSDGFIYDGVASAVAEGACDAVEARLTENLRFKNRFSPGYSDCPLKMQRDIFDLLPADKYIGVKLLDGDLMSPMKSVSAFIALVSDKEKK